MPSAGFGGVLAMQLGTMLVDGRRQVAVGHARGWISIRELNASAGAWLPDDFKSIIRCSIWEELRRLLGRLDPAKEAPIDEAPAFAVPYRPHGKIWGIGLNYQAHARDLNEEVPPQPASFMKPATAVIGFGEAIEIPEVSQRVTAEAELGVIIGERCRNVSVDDAPRVIFGYVPVIDMTAEDILRINPRFLTRAKSFDTFLSLGPVVISPDEVADLDRLEVRTIVNGEVRAQNVVANMTYSPYELIAFHSRGMTLEPGDVILTGTPGAWPIRPGDVVQCSITGFPVLENPVVAGTGTRAGGQRV